MVFLVEQAGVHLDVTYQQQAQGRPYLSPDLTVIGRTEVFEREEEDEEGGSQQFVDLLAARFRVKRL